MKPSRRLQKTNKEQYLLTIPKDIVGVLGWNDKDEIEFSLENGKVVLNRRKSK